MRVLITRGAEDAQAYVEQIEARGAEIIFCPVITIHPLSPELPDNIRALVFTSRHAIRQFCALSSDRKTSVYVVGPQSAQEARAAGFRTVHEGPGRAEDLLALIKAADAPILYARGRDIAFDLAQTLNEAGIKTHEAMLYEARAVDELPDFGSPDLALFFSARGAEIFCDLVQKQGLAGRLAGTKALCLGAGMVESLSTLPWRDVAVATSPDRAAFRALIDDNIKPV